MLTKMAHNTPTHAFRNYAPLNLKILLQTFVKLIKFIRMAKTVKLQELNRQYEFVCNEYVTKFCSKQKLDFDGWIGDEIGGIASFACQYFFNLSDIILDLNTKQQKGNILNWQSEDVDFNMFNENKKHINYKSYTMGLRHEQFL